MTSVHASTRPRTYSNRDAANAVQLFGETEYSLAPPPPVTTYVTGRSVATELWRIGTVRS